MTNNGIFISSDKKAVSPAEASAIYVELGWGTAKEYSSSLAKGTDIYGETERKNFSFLEGYGYKKRKGLIVFVERSKK